MKPLSKRLRELKTLNGPLPEFCTEQLPEQPYELFLKWLEEALRHDVKEPHAMILSTVDESGHPDARILILKDVDSKGFYFATSSLSKKGIQIQATPHVSLTFYWQPLGRQVRIRGIAHKCDRLLNERDFLGREETARAIALIGKQSTVLKTMDDIQPELDKQLDRIKQNQLLIDPFWALYRVEPKEIEFWQGSQDRNHTRVKYMMNKGDWLKELLWP